MDGAAACRLFALALSHESRDKISEEHWRTAREYSFVLEAV
jgi:hypothetical protein